jgi:hypothetical protein
MLLGAALVLVGSAVLYYAVTGKDPRHILTDTGAITTAKPKQAKAAPAASIAGAGR